MAGRDRNQRQSNTGRVQPPGLGLRYSGSTGLTTSSTIAGVPGTNTEPHQKFSSSTPPATGPIVIPLMNNQRRPVIRTTAQSATSRITWQSERSDALKQAYPTPPHTQRSDFLLNG